jgi:hypothetical protein
LNSPPGRTPRKAMLDKIRTFAEYKIVRFLFALFLIIPFGLFGID